MPSTKRPTQIVLRHATFAGLLMVAQSSHAVVGFDWASVGNPGNPADTLVMTKGAGLSIDNTTGYGSVGYTYNIAKYDVTNAQYVEYLNKVDPTGADGVAATLGSPNPSKFFDKRMASNPLGVSYTGGIDLTVSNPVGSKYSTKAGQANNPVTWINWTNAARFVNWMSNGQGSGGTESGVYDISSVTGVNIHPAVTPTRAAGSTIYLPTENEWYKAAYYDPTKGGTGYWQYATRSDTDPLSGPPPGGSNTMNYGAGASHNTALNYVTDVGAYPDAKSYYGLYDMDSNVYTWTDSFKQNPNSGGGTGLMPIYRGGSWYQGPTFTGAAYHNIYSWAYTSSYHWYGLRLASYGLIGDANLDGKVSTTDFNSVAGSFGQSGKLWANGDFDYSGTVDSIDFGLLVANYGKTLPTASTGLGTVVPEPACASLIVGAMSLFGTRQANRRKHINAKRGKLI